MAILLNIISTGARRSAGAATFRRVRGRTIMSQKRSGSNKALETRAASGLVRTYREALFFIMSAFADGMQNTINESFEPTRFGSRRNAFFKLNYSAVEKAVNGSSLGLALLDQVMHNVSFTGVSVGGDEAPQTISAFNELGWNDLFSAASSADVSGSYIRSNIGGTKYQGFDETWNSNPDPGTAQVLEMVVSVGASTTAGQNIERIVIAGRNIVYPLSYSIRVGSSSATPLTGSWTGNNWRPSGDSATQRWASTMTVYITDGTRVLHSRDVNFYSGNPSAGGE